MSIAKGAPPLRFVLATYDLSGAWLGLANWTVQLQACGGPTDHAAAWAAFGTSYATACAVAPAELLALADYSGSSPRFYDPFIVQDDGSLYPIPVRVTNRAGGEQVRALRCWRASGARERDPTHSQARWVRPPTPAHTCLLPSLAPPPLQAGHVRRFFFVDDTLSAPAGQAPRAVVYPSDMRLAVTIRADRRDHITPPLLTITCAARPPATLVASRGHRARRPQ